MIYISFFKREMAKREKYQQVELCQENNRRIERINAAIATQSQDGADSGDHRGRALEEIAEELPTADADEGGGSGQHQQGQSQQGGVVIMFFYDPWGLGGGF